MNRSFLFGCALGAGLATFSFLVGMWLSDGEGDRRIVLNTSIGSEDQAILIKAAGSCIGHFKAEMTDHTFSISYPVHELSKGEIICLIEKAGSSKHDIWITEVP